MFERRQKERPKPSPLRIGHGKIVFLKHSGEKLLSQILGLIDFVATPPDAEKRHFATTRWSVVLAAGNHQRDDAQEALTRLCETYWYPLYAYVRRRVESVYEAQDLTQEFFARVLEKDYVAAADPDRGRFRAFLLTAFKHFLSKERDKARAQKRGGGRAPLSLDFASGESRYVAGPAETLTPDQLYDRQWTIALLDRVMRRLEEEMRKSGKAYWFERLKEFIAGGGSEDATYAKTAESLGTTEAAAKMATHRMRKRYRELLRHEIAETVEHVADIEDEIRGLFTAFSG
jgi:RNA polymerase sigma factor (sigma-70 family)